MNAGLKDDADRFFYRAQVCRRGVQLLRLRPLNWLFSWILFAIAGYGYRPLRSVITYLLVMAGFAAIYLGLGGAGAHLERGAGGERNGLLRTRLLRPVSSQAGAVMSIVAYRNPWSVGAGIAPAGECLVLISTPPR